MNALTRADAIDRTTTVAWGAYVASGTWLVDSGINNPRAGSADARPRDADIARCSGLIDAWVNDTHTRCANAHPGRRDRSGHAAFRYSHALAINHRIR
jgi:hypothetical protein